MKEISILKTGSEKVKPGGEMHYSHHPYFNARILFPVIGILLVILGNVPFFILGGKSVISVREQLDGEIVGYMLGAKYLFSGASFYPEFLGGVYKSALVAPSYGTILFYRLLDPLHAFLVNQLIVMLTGFIGMYLWGVKLSGKRFISFVSALLFAFLPYFTVYGITVSGVPLFAWALFELLEGKKSPKIILAYILIAFYGAFSSLVLCGYAVIAVSAVFLLGVILFDKKRHFRIRGRIKGFFGILELSAIYLVLNRDLISQILNPAGSYLSHKSEMRVADKPFLETLKELFISGSAAVPSLHVFIFYGTVFVLALALGVSVAGRKSRINGGIKSEIKSGIKSGIKSRIKSCQNENELDKIIKVRSRILLGFLICALLISLFSCVLHFEPIAARITEMGGALKSFQIDRFYWLFPFIWYSALVLIGDLLKRIIPRFHIGQVLWIILVIPCAAYVLKESAFKENVMEFVRKDSTALTWDAFFCEEEFKEVAEYIKSETGMDQSMYRVGSLGIEPSVSFYSGFYTIDGYSNNYELSYKHRFRKAIKKELEKNDYNREYFDLWGNRCYLFSSEYYGNPLLTKYEHAHFDDLELDTEALKDLGCSYILASGEIKDAKEKGFKLSKVFDDYSYTYFIYLYEVL